MQSHKSPSSMRYAADMERREIIATRRATATSQKEGTASRIITAVPKHNKLGKRYGNPNSRATITFKGGNMMGPMFKTHKVTREIVRPLDKQNWELSMPKHWKEYIG
jgi:hypothetical protein